MNAPKKFPNRPEDEANAKKIIKTDRSLRKVESHYGIVQVKFKEYAVMWFLVTFAAAGLVLFTKQEQLPIPFYVLICFIGLVSFLGIVAFAIHDFMISKRSADVAFFEGLKLEKEFPWLPQCRHNLLKSSKFLRYISILFYLFLGTVSLLACGGIFSFSMLKLTTIGGIASFLFVILLVFFFYLFLCHIYPDTDKMQQNPDSIR